MLSHRVRIDESSFTSRNVVHNVECNHLSAIDLAVRSDQER